MATIASPFYANPSIAAGINNLGSAIAGPDPRQRAAAILTGARGAQAVNKIRGGQAVGDMVNGIDVNGPDVATKMREIYAAGARYGLDPQKLNLMIRGVVANTGGNAGQVISSLVGSGVVPNVNSTVTRDDQLKRRGEIDTIKRRGQDVSAYATMNRVLNTPYGVYDPKTKTYNQTGGVGDFVTSRTELNKARAGAAVATAAAKAAGKAGDPSKGVIKMTKYDQDTAAASLPAVSGVDDVEKIDPKLRTNYYAAFSTYFTRPTINGQPNPAYKNHGLAAKAAKSLLFDKGLTEPNMRSSWNPKSSELATLKDKNDPYGDRRLQSLIGTGSRTAADVVTGGAKPAAKAPAAGMDPLPRGLGGKIDAKRLEVGRVYQTPRGPAIYKGGGRFEAK